MNIPPRSLHRQAGVMLIEGLIAILIFSLGILAIVGMQSMAVKQVTDARNRSDAAMLASQLFGAMWVTDRSPGALAAFKTGGAEYDKWKNNVAAILPGGYDPDVQVDPENTVIVEIKWRAPGEAALPGGSADDVHRYKAIAQIK